MNRIYLVLVFAAITSLFGCASLDLATDPTGLSASDREIAKKMSEMTTSRCSRYKYDPTSGRQMSGNVGFHQATEVKKLFSSTNNGWFKADVVNQGVWDSVYYNRISGRFVCGEKLWATDVGSNEAAFIEIIKGQTASNTIPSTTPVNTSPSPSAAGLTCVRGGTFMSCEKAKAYDDERVKARKLQTSDGAKSAEQRLTELKSLLEKGLITPEQYDRKRVEILNSL